MKDDFRTELADALRGKHWSLYACQGDAYFSWDQCSDVTRDAWLQIADRAIQTFERYNK